MIDPCVLRHARRLCAAYSRSFAGVPHRRTASTLGAYAPTALAYPLTTAYREASIIEHAKGLGWTCEHEYETEAWDGDCDAPEYMLCVIIRDESGTVRASLGMVGVNSLSDPYLTSVEAELYSEAIAGKES